MKKQLSLETVSKLLSSPNGSIRAAAMEACHDITEEIPLDILLRGMSDENLYVQAYAVPLCEGRKDIPVEVIKNWIGSGLWEENMAAMYTCIGRPDIPLSFIQHGLQKKDYLEEEGGSSIRDIAARACEGRTDISVKTIREWLKHDSVWQTAAMYACQGRYDIPIGILEDGIRNKNTRSLAVSAFKGRTDITVDRVQGMLDNPDPYLRAAGLNACIGREVPISILERGIEDTDRLVWPAVLAAYKEYPGGGLSCIPSVSTIVKWMESPDEENHYKAMFFSKGRMDVPIAVIEKGIKEGIRCAAEACEGRTDIRIKTIKKWLNRGRMEEVYAYAYAYAAMMACVGREDVPCKLLNQGLRSKDFVVSQTAQRAARGRSGVLPIRSFEPPKHVYTRCYNGVILVSEIPDDAHVYGVPGKKCCASKAAIVDIIGDTCGEKLGVAYEGNMDWNEYGIYKAGDVFEARGLADGPCYCAEDFFFYCSLEDMKPLD